MGQSNRCPCDGPDCFCSEHVEIALAERKETMDRNEIKKTVAAGIRDFFSNLFGEKTEPARFTEEQIQRFTEAAQKPLREKIATLSAQFAASVHPALRGVDGLGAPELNSPERQSPGAGADVLNSKLKSANYDPAIVADRARQYAAERAHLGLPVSATEAVAHVMRQSSVEATNPSFAEEKEQAEKERKTEFAEKAAQGNVIRNSARIAAMAREFQESRHKAGHPVETTEAVNHVLETNPDLRTLCFSEIANSSRVGTAEEFAALRRMQAAR
jgi:hypothetical protein